MLQQDFKRLKKWGRLLKVGRGRAFHQTGKWVKEQAGSGGGGRASNQGIYK